MGQFRWEIHWGVGSAHRRPEVNKTIRDRSSLLGQEQEVSPLLSAGRSLGSARNAGRKSHADTWAPAMAGHALVKNPQCSTAGKGGVFCVLHVGVSTWIPKEKGQRPVSEPAAGPVSSHLVPKCTLGSQCRTAAGDPSSGTCCCSREGGVEFPSLEPRLDLMACLTKTNWWKRWSGSSEALQLLSIFSPAELE